MKEIEIIINQLEKLFQKTEIIMDRLDSLMPLNSEKVENEEVFTKIDSFIFRISKIQDLMGQQLFKRVLIELEEYKSSMSMIDILNKLEKFEILEKEEWRKFRQIRNNLSHSYTDDADEIESILTESFKMLIKMKTIFEKVKEKYESS